MENLEKYVKDAGGGLIMIGGPRSFGAGGYLKTPVEKILPVFMDLPLLTGSEVPHAPYLAVSAKPWPGNVAVYSASDDEGYALSGLIPGQAIIGVTEGPLMRATPGIWDEGAPLRVKLIDGVLESRPRQALLNGANLAAIGDGTPGN